MTKNHRSKLLSFLITMTALILFTVSAWSVTAKSDEYDDPEPSGSIWIDDADYVLDVGDTGSATASWDSSDRADSYPVWSSQGGCISITVSQGVVYYTANYAGSAVLSVDLYCNDVCVSSDSITVSVNDPQPQPTPEPTPTPKPTYISVTGIDVGTSSMSLRKGDSQYMNSKVRPSDANNSGISYSTSDSNVAYVDSAGKVYAAGEGTCTITARTNENGYSATCKVTVSDDSPKNLPVTKVAINPGSLTIGIGQAAKLNAVISPSNTSSTTVIWDSANPQIATVDGSGNVYGKAVGYAVINCTSANNNSKKASIVVTVTANKVNNKNVNNLTNANNKAVASNTSTHSAALNFMTISQIITAKKNANVVIEQDKPMSYDVTVATVLATRPDVTLTCKFPLNGIKFALTLPKGFNLTQQLDKSGYVDWLTLCTVKGASLKIVK